MNIGDVTRLGGDWLLAIESEEQILTVALSEKVESNGIELQSADVLSGDLPVPGLRVDLSQIRTLTRDECAEKGTVFHVKEAFVARVLKAIVMRHSRLFSKLSHRANLPASSTNRTPFESGKSTIPYAGRIFDADEVEAAIGTTLDFWLTLGSEGAAFEKELAAQLGVQHSLLVNSGSSANLLAVAALTTHKLPDDRRIVPGDEVITCAAGFPTTVAPIVQNGAVPVFIDNDPATGNGRMEQLEAAFCEGKTKAVMMAHTLGNPFDLGAVLEFCRKHRLWLIEDNCDALGSLYSMPEERARRLELGHLLKIAKAGSHGWIKFEEINGQKLLTAPTGCWGDLSTQSFYPPHHLTMGEGGAVNIVSRGGLKSYAESFRDWGRDCWCPSGKDNTCNRRFGWQLGELPEGYDHKYIYSHLGYNLKPLDIQAAIGRKQLEKLPEFTEARKRNWDFLRRGLADLDEFLEFTLPTHATAWNAETGFQWDNSGCRSECSWFGFMLRMKTDGGGSFTPSKLGRYLDERKIGSRMLFGGNLLRQPVLVQLKKDRPEALRTIGEMPGADTIMNTALFLGTFPGLTEAMLQYEVEAVRSFFRG